MSTRRPLTLAELTGVLAPVGRPVAERPLSGGWFASVQAVEVVPRGYGDRLVAQRATLLDALGA